MTESVTLSFFGGAAGLWFLWVTQMALTRVVAVIPSPTSGPYQLDLDLEPATLAVAFGLSLVMGLGLGSFPAVAALRRGSAEALRTRGEAGNGHVPRFSLRNSLLVTQLALDPNAVLRSE